MSSAIILDLAASVDEEDHSLGPSTAPVTVVQYADFDGWDLPLLRRAILSAAVEAF